MKAWTQLTREQQRVWKFVAAGFVAGTAFKVGYFRFSRGIIMEDSKRQHVEGLERLKEAREFAEWSRKDKEARLPELTDEQREQMRQYLQLVGKHGVTQAASNEDCVGCPVVRNATEILGLRTQTE